MEPGAPKGLMNHRRSFTSLEGTRDQRAKPTVKMDPDKTVRGSLHWLSVMTEKQWESMYTPVTQT